MLSRFARFIPQRVTSAFNKRSKHVIFGQPTESCGPTTESCGQTTIDPPISGFRGTGFAFVIRRSFHVSAPVCSMPDRSLMLENSTEFQAIFYLTDFIKVEKELGFKNIQLLSVPARKKKQVLIYPRRDFRLVTLFNIEVPESSDLETPAPLNQFLFNTKNLLGHSTYSDQEFELVKNECNKEFLKKYKVTCDVQALVGKLCGIRNNAHKSYRFRVKN